MNDIILDARRIRAYECFLDLGEYTAKENTWLDELWAMLVENDELMDEFMYYLDNHMILDKMCINGMSLTDLFVQEMSRFNIFNDTGKNTGDCNKEAMILNTFYAMGKLMAKPSDSIKRLEEDRGMDKM